MSKEKPTDRALGRAVSVRWIDSMASGGWGDLKPSDMNCISVGILVGKTKDRIVIAQNASSTSFGHHMEIPRVAVKSVRRLK